MASKFGRRDYSRALFLCLGWVLIFASQPSDSTWAQTNVLTSSADAHRYVFVIETSKTMQRRAQGTLHTVQAALDSRLAGQLRQGDMLGMWAYNQSITQATPFERWDSQNHDSVARHLTNFLYAQKYENEARIEGFWPEVERLIHGFPNVTVVLLSAGENKLAGTPFDGQINQAWQQWKDDQQKARMPIVTVLRVSEGKFVNWSVTPAPWPAEFAPAMDSARSALVEPPRTARALTNAVSQKTVTRKPEFSPLLIVAATSPPPQVGVPPPTASPQPTGLTAGASTASGTSTMRQTNIVDTSSSTSMTGRVSSDSTPVAAPTIQQTNYVDASPSSVVASQNLAGLTTIPATMPGANQTTNGDGATGQKSEPASNVVSAPLPAANQAPPPSAQKEVAYRANAPSASPAGSPASTQTSEVTRGTEDPVSGVNFTGAPRPSRETASDPPPGGPPTANIVKSANSEPTTSSPSGERAGTQIPDSNPEPPASQTGRLSWRHLAVFVLLILAVSGSVFCFFMYAKSRSRARQKGPRIPREPRGRQPQASPPAEQQEPAETRSESHPSTGVRPSSGAATSEEGASSSESEGTMRAESVTPNDAPAPLKTSTDFPAPEPPTPAPTSSRPSQPPNPPRAAQES